MPLPGHPVPGPDRDPADKMGRAVEASPERIRCHLRRPVPGRRNLLTMTAGNTVRETDPCSAAVIPWRGPFRQPGVNYRLLRLRSPEASPLSASRHHERGPGVMRCEIGAG